MATAAIMILFSQYIKDVPLPVPSCTKSKTGSIIKKIYIFRLFPVLLTILVMWLVCVVLTITDVLPEGDFARADANLDLIKKVNWFRIPYPCTYEKLPKYIVYCLKNYLGILRHIQAATKSVINRRVIKGISRFFLEISPQ